MWIFCCGMPRSGSTLQYQITAKLVEDAGRGKRLGWCLPKDFPQLRDEHENYGKIKVCKSHVATDEIIKEFDKQNALGVYIFRDIRDVVVSHMRKYSTDFREILKIKFVEMWLDNYYKWVNLDNVLVSKYEVVTADLATEVKRIAKHLGLSLNRKEYSEIASRFNINKQLARIETFKSTLPAGELNKSEAVIDPHSQLHINHIHSGEVGGWKKILSGEEVLTIEKKSKEWLKENGYLLSNQTLR